MKKMFVIGLVLLTVLILGCSKPAEVPSEPKAQPSVPSPSADDSGSQDVQAENDAPDVCSSDISPQQLKMVKVVDLTRESDGFSFNLLLRDEADENNVVVEGNAAVVVYNTKLRNNKHVADKEVYRTAVRLKQDMVAGDCTYPRISVKFAEYDKEVLKNLIDGDLGVLNVRLSFIGGSNLETDYVPGDATDSLLP